MGASDSKLAFRKGVFRLSEQADIPETEEEYWNGFTSLPEGPDDVFQLISTTDIRKTLDTHPTNIKTLLKKITKVLLDFSMLEELPTKLQSKSAVNSLRILTKLMPFVFERGYIEQDVFWTVVVEEAQRSNHPEKRQEEKTPEAFLSPVPAEEVLAPLAERLLRALLNLLFLPGFTLPGDLMTADKRIRYIIWEAGVGSSQAPVASAEHIVHRMETLKCLLVLMSHSMYTLPADLIKTTNPWMHFMVTSLDKQAVLGILCSLLNTVIAYSPSGWVPYDHIIFGDQRENYVQVASELLIALLNYSQGLAAASAPSTSSESLNLEESSSSQSRRPSVDAILPVKLEEREKTGANLFRFYLSKLHRTSDFKLIFDGICSLISNPLQANSTYLPYSMKQLSFTEEILMVFWKLIEINRRFFSYVTSNDKVLDVTAALVFQTLSSKNNPARIGLVRMCSFILHVLSGERAYAVLLNKPFMATLPAYLELPLFKGCYGDLVLLSLFTLTFTTKGKLMNLYDCFLTIIANLSPYIKSFSVVTANKLVLMFTTFSNPAFLMSNETNHVLCFFLLDTFNNILQYQFDGNAHLVYEILRHKESFDSLRQLTFEKASEALERAREKKKKAMERAMAASKPEETSGSQEMLTNEEEVKLVGGAKSEPVSPLEEPSSDKPHKQAVTAPASPTGNTANIHDIGHKSAKKPEVPRSAETGKFQANSEWVFAYKVVDDCSSTIGMNNFHCRQLLPYWKTLAHRLNIYVKRITGMTKQFFNIYNQGHLSDCCQYLIQYLSESSNMQMEFMYGSLVTCGA